jgi:hypothetical protein
MGFELSLAPTGALRVKQPAGVEVSPVMADEIRARAPGLVKLLELYGYFGRPLVFDDVARAKALASECGVELEWKRIDLNALKPAATLPEGRIRDE